MTLLFMAAGVFSARADYNANYYDYATMVGDVTAKLRTYLKAHPGHTTDSLRANVLSTLTDPPVGKASDLTSPRNYPVVASVGLSGALGRTDQHDRARFVMDCDGNVFPVTDILALDPLNDWAIIKVDPCGHKLTPAPVGGDIPVGTPVYCLASPSQAHFHFTDGMVSNLTRSTNKRTGHTTYILEITSDYGVGASGGPIFDECGNLVALVSSTISIYAQPEQYRNFQMAYKQTVPVFLIKEQFK